MTPLEAFLAQTPSLKAWLLWLFAINAVSIVFARRVEARWVFAAWVLNLITMVLLMKTFGGGHHMSLPHVLFWTPLLVYLASRARLIAQQPRVYAVWVALLGSSIGISLSLDYLNLAKWALA